jgi:hypothetical protein
MAVIFQILAILILTPCDLVGGYRRFGGTFCPLNIYYTTFPLTEIGLYFLSAL